MEEAKIYFVKENGELVEAIEVVAKAFKEVKKAIGNIGNHLNSYYIEAKINLTKEQRRYLFKSERQRAKMEIQKINGLDNYKNLSLKMKVAVVKIRIENRKNEIQWQN